MGGLFFGRWEQSLAQPVIISTLPSPSGAPNFRSDRPSPGGLFSCAGLRKLVEPCAIVPDHVIGYGRHPARDEAAHDAQQVDAETCKRAAVAAISTTSRIVAASRLEESRVAVSPSANAAERLDEGAAQLLIRRSERSWRVDLCRDDAGTGPLIWATVADVTADQALLAVSLRRQRSLELALQLDETLVRESDLVTGAVEIEGVSSDFIQKYALRLESNSDWTWIDPETGTWSSTSFAPAWPNVAPSA